MQKVKHKCIDHSMQSIDYCMLPMQWNSIQFLMEYENKVPFEKE